MYNIYIYIYVNRIQSVCHPSGWPEKKETVSFTAPQRNAGSTLRSAWGADLGVLQTTGVFADAPAEEAEE